MKKQKLFTRNFTLLILGQASSLVGNNALKFALSMYVLERTGSAAVFSALLAAAMLPTILLSPLGGILADRLNRRNVMVALDGITGAVALAAGVIFLPGGNVFIAGALLFALAVLSASESPTVQACVPQMLTGDNLIKGNAAVNQVQAITALITPFLGSVAYAAFGLTPVLFGAAACFTLTAVLECFIQLDFQKAEKGMRAGAILKEDFSLSMRFLLKERPAVLKLLLLAALVSLFVAGTVVVGFPYLVRSVLGLSAQHYGAAESAMGAAAVLGSLFVGIMAQKLRVRWLTAVFMGFGLCLVAAGAAFLLPLDTMSRYAMLLAAFCLSQFGCSLFSTCAVSIIQSRTPNRLMGRIMSYVFALSMCAQPVGQIVYGALFDGLRGNPHWALLPSGLMVCVIAAASAKFFVKLESA